MKQKPQPWIFSPGFDLGFIVGPALLVTAFVIAFQDTLVKSLSVSPAVWLALIVGVDVSHVYSTVFRTYLDREELHKRQALYILAPLGAWLAGCFLYSMDALFFWRVLAYLAVYHFIRQQYGFMMLYSRQERDKSAFSKRLDQALVYMATLYPLIFWHTHPRQFEWFVEGDFLAFNAATLSKSAGILYLALIALYIAKEARQAFMSRQFNIPKNLLLLGTGISWYTGIIAFDNDLAFTATNVIAHGIPYTALIWIYGRNQNALKKGKAPYIASWINRLFRTTYIPLYLGLLLLAAFIEEGLWDGFLWREHGRLFGFANLLPPVQSEAALTWLVPLLTLPQATHYILDAFIWRRNLKDSEWKEILFLKK